MRERPDPTRRLSGLRSAAAAARGVAGVDDAAAGVSPAGVSSAGVSAVGVSAVGVSPAGRKGWIPDPDEPVAGVSAASRPGFGATAPRRTARHRRKDAPPADTGSRPASHEPAQAPHQGAGAARGDADDSSDPAEGDDPDDADGPDSAREGGPPREGVAGAARRLTGGPWGRLAEKWVPESLRDARIDPGRRGALLLTVIAALAAVVAAVGVWRDRPEPRPVQPVALAPATSTVAPSRARPGHRGPGLRGGGDATSAGPGEGSGGRSADRNQSVAAGVCGRDRDLRLGNRSGPATRPGPIAPGCPCCGCHRCRRWSR